jgi:CheY-like chemotaxis protein
MLKASLQYNKMASKNIVILIGDDDSSLRKAFGRTIMPYEAHQASTGEELVEQAKQSFETGNLYSLIVSDHEYGSGINGIEAVRRIRAFDKTTPILWHSGRVNPARGNTDPLIMQAAQAGATHSAFKDGSYFSDLIDEYRKTWEAQDKSE